MSVTEGHFGLSVEQRRFRDLLRHYPRLMNYWDFGRRECDIEGLRKDLGVLSHGEQLMGRFFVSVWLGNDEALHFPLMEAVRSLGSDDIARIAEWLQEPFFP